MTPLGESAGRSSSAPEIRRLETETGLMAGRLHGFLTGALGDDDGSLADGLAFLKARFDFVSQGHALSAWPADPFVRRPMGRARPIDRLAKALSLTALEFDLIVLAGMAEEHEGYADVFKMVSPRGEPRPAVGLASQLFEVEGTDRFEIRRTLEVGAAVRSGVLVVEGSAPFHQRRLGLSPSVWSALQGIRVWPPPLRRLDRSGSTCGLHPWLESDACREAGDALSANQPVTVIVSAADPETALQRAWALLRHRGIPGAALDWPADASDSLEALVRLHSLIQARVPVLRVQRPDGPRPLRLPIFRGHPGPAVVCIREGAAAHDQGRALIGLSCPRLRPVELRGMWAEALSELSREAPTLAARYPVEPHQARRTALDLRSLSERRGRECTLHDVAESLRTRSSQALEAGVKLVRPTARWDSLILPADRLVQLREAVNRLVLQVRVLDEWRFLDGRSGARGVRMMFCGPSGTGKTLSAEVMAGELDVDLMVVDLSRVVSKWIGETEKNLSRVFDAAERSRSVLLFDEADALFGKRTEVSDAHDRYANLETAYLLTRLERFEGLAILSTNLRQNIDDAFTRRLEFIVDYQEPRRADRLALWRCHIPDTAPMEEDVALQRLADFYPMVGGLIRNAATAAGFLAAAEESAIGNRHLLQAIRREFVKAAKPFPGVPVGMVDQKKRSL